MPLQITECTELIVDNIPCNTQHFREGVGLFNAGAFWHAHEAWEACWLQASEPDKTFYQGLIQAAAALVHWQKGNLRGLHRNWFKARPKLVALPRVLHGIEIGALVVAMDQFVLADGVRGSAPRLDYQRGAGSP